MKIYFAGSIRGNRNREDIDMYFQLIKYLNNFGEVLTEHVGNKSLEKLDDNTLNDNEIHDRDMKWLLSSDVVVAEVTQASLGVGYEIGRAVEHNKHILCLYRPITSKKLSAMINGSSKVQVKKYTTIDIAKTVINTFFNLINKSI